MNELALVESKSLRDEKVNSVEVLDKVKSLTMLPDDLHVTFEMAANYYEVAIETVKSTIKYHRDEFENDGMKILKGNELKKLREGQVEFQPDLRFAPQLTLIPRRALLRIGMLLRDSEVAKTVRSYLLNVEQIARAEAPHVN